MTYKTVMVGLALGQPNDARLEVAAQLAKWFGARVIGVAAAEFSPPLYFTEGEPAQRLIDQGWAAVKNRLKELEGGFRAAMQNRAVEVEWRCGEDFPTRFIVRQARASDIIVVGEAAGGGLADPFVQVNPSDLVMQVGRPLLVVPESCSWLDLRSVLVAWKDTAEARRAVNDALPLLRRGMAYGHRSRCPGNVAMPPRNWSKWHRTSAPAWLLPALMATSCSVLWKPFSSHEGLSAVAQARSCLMAVEESRPLV